MAFMIDTMGGGICFGCCSENSENSTAFICERNSKSTLGESAVGVKRQA